MPRKLLLVSLIVLAACKAPEPPASPPASEVAFTALKAEQVTLQHEFPGRAVAYRVAEIRPQVSGLIRKRNFEEGSLVAAGQLLYQIEPERYQAAHDEAEAALANTRAGLASVRDRASRYDALMDVEAVSRQQQQEAHEAYVQAQANVRAGEAAARRSRVDLANTRLTAPIAGRVGRSTVSEGALVRDGQDAALTVVQQLDPIYIDFVQSSQQWLQQQRGNKPGSLAGARAKLVLEDGSVYPHAGNVRLAESSVDAATGAVTLRAQFPNPDGVLLPGMFVRTVVEMGKRDGVLRVPQQSVTRNPQGKPVALVVAADQRVEQRVLTTEGTDADHWIVTAGLKSGERLIVEGGQRVKPGDKVKAVALAKADASPSPDKAVK
ncbi:Multidrug resistance protein MexA [Andreprevotia sp. IGB-42]|uniref:efflux RND transporter periplasmic adaptor subunit n=1 Tax=Andreprevotia sp. IGB-42 TaxID=2497473 RepID=UPI001357132F|nr:efflux RND transporter periplasmic adaptor subunit [Andreprevotia sp. IGB-42]KAF0812633.1 Multidrug resistance protein MexA [Andreprevotia sp. IGB-42]